jgi:hypothetical protein
MSCNWLKKVATGFLATMLVVPAVAFIQPHKAEATGLPVVDISNLLENTINVVENTISAVSSVTQAASDIMQIIKEYVLEPIAFVTSGNLMKALTAGVIEFVNGKTNGTGASQFVQSLQNNLQKVSDNQATAFLIQFGKHSNSPFAASIGSSLRNNYYQETSLAGFFAKNRNTLPQFSSDPEAFLRGDWSKGGIDAWMALTTQPENNPYLLHARAQEEMALMVQEKTAERLNQLAWGGGFMSWCGGTADKDACNADGNPGTLQASGLCLPNTQKDQQGNNVAATPDQAGDACIKKDGTPGKIQTPGSVIKSTLDKALGVTADKLAQMGNTATQINSILGNIASIMDTVNFASGILGSASVNGMTGGLLGATEDRPDGGTYMDTYRNNTSGFGVSIETVMNGATQSTTLNGQQYLENVSDYEKNWNTIYKQATTTAGVLAQLKLDLGQRICVDKGYTLDALAIDRAVSDSVTPAFEKYAQASTTIVAARSFIKQMLIEASSTEPGARERYLADVQSLANRAPTARDIAYALQQSTETRAATPAIEDSFALDLMDGTMIDRLKLLVTNAVKLRQRCLIPTR